jgi:HTH-type transcriptional regulator/antitoxin HigA
VEIKVIKTDEEHETALVEFETSLNANPPAGTPEADRLELLALLIRDYEDEHYPIPSPDPIEAIKFRMEQEGLTRKDLEAYIGSSSKVSEVLNRKRKLSLGMIRALHKGLDIPAEVLIEESARSTRSRPAKSGFRKEAV